jgi:hypothetical protein
MASISIGTRQEAGLKANTVGDAARAAQTQTPGRMTDIAVYLH